MRVVFAGSADFSVPVLRALARSSHEVVDVLTSPERRGSRGGAAPRPVREAAEELGLALEQPPRLDPEQWRRSPALAGAEVLAVAAYGLLVPDPILAALPQGGLGVHPSLLPRHRGASPVAAAILAGDSRTGVTVFRMERRMDAGPILAQEPVAMPPRATAEDLRERLAVLGGELLVQVLDRLGGEGVEEMAQLESGATYSHRLGRRDGELDWERPALEIERRLRALMPWPGVTVPLAGQRVKLLRGGAGEEPGEERALPPGAVLERGPDWLLLQTGEGAFRVELVQPPGGRAMSPVAFLRGRGRGPREGLELG